MKRIWIVIPLFALGLVLMAYGALSEHEAPPQQAGQASR